MSLARMRNKAGAGAASLHPVMGSLRIRLVGVRRGLTRSPETRVKSPKARRASLRRPWDYVRWTEDFLPGTAPTAVLEPEAWTVTDDSVVFAAVGDTGTGGRNQMDVAQAMVDAYTAAPYGFVAHVGDVSYRGSILDRWEDVWVRPYKPLFGAGVRFEVALGNHELEEGQSDETLQWIEARLEQLGYAKTYRVSRTAPWTSSSSIPARPW